MQMQTKNMFVFSPYITISHFILIPGTLNIIKQTVAILRESGMDNFLRYHVLKLNFSYKYTNYWILVACIVLIEMDISADTLCDFH